MSSSHKYLGRQSHYTILVTYLRHAAQAPSHYSGRVEAWRRHSTQLARKLGRNLSDDLGDRRVSVSVTRFPWERRAARAAS